MPMLLFKSLFADVKRVQPPTMSLVYMITLSYLLCLRHFVVSGLHTFHLVTLAAIDLAS